jgi:hypothetical protein
VINSKVEDLISGKMMVGMLEMIIHPNVLVSYSFCTLSQAVATTSPYPREHTKRKTLLVTTNTVHTFRRLNLFGFIFTKGSIFSLNSTSEG